MKPLLLDGNYIYSKAPWLSWGELLLGLEKGYIDEKGVSEYVCDALTSSSPKEAVEIASLEVNDYYLVPDLLKSLIGNHSWTESDLAKPWIFLLLSFLLENKENYNDPLGLVEELYADFDYPEEVAPLVRYMPLPEGVEGSEERLFENWKTFISDYTSILPKKANPATKKTDSQQ